MSGSESVAPTPRLLGRSDRRGTWLTTAALWVWFVVVALIRLPELIFGRPPYAEEAVTFYRYAASHGLFETLSFRLGYLSLWSNLSAFLETRLPLRWLPQVSMLLGVAGPMLVVALVIRANAVWWRRGLAIAAVASTLTMLSEWASVIHFQFWAMCAMMLLIALPVHRPWQRYSDVVIAIFTGLSGVASIAVVPWLALSAWRSSGPLRQHRLRLTAVLAVTSVFNAIVSQRRPSAMPLGLWMPLLALKVVWQPITGTWGNGFGIWLTSQNALVANTIALVILGAAIALIVTVTWGAWRIVALGSLGVGAFMLWFSIPPVRGLMLAELGGRYAVASVVPLAVALSVSDPRRRNSPNQTDQTDQTGQTDGIDERTDDRQPTPPLDRRRRLAEVVAIAYVAVSVIVGVAQGIDRPDYGVNRAAAFGRDYVAYQTDPGVTFDTAWGGCRLTPDPVAQSAGSSVTIDQDANVITVTGVPADVDRALPTSLYVIGQYADGTSVNLVDGVSSGGVFIGGERVPRCFNTPDPIPASSAKVTGQHQVTIDLSEAPRKVVAVIAAVGRTYNDALTKGAAQFVDVPPKN